MFSPLIALAFSDTEAKKKKKGKEVNQTVIKLKPLFNEKKVKEKNL